MSQHETLDRDTVESETIEREAAEREAAEREAAEREAAEREAAEHGAAEREAVEREALGRAAVDGGLGFGPAQDEPQPLVKRPVYEIRLDAFEGPLDLLLHLIREHEIDIYDIPIAEITEQYLEYIGLMESLDLALAGEFMEMAATLIRIKVQMLLPSQAEEGQEEEDPREQLVRKLVEYKKFKEAAKGLSGREEDRRRYFPRGVDPRDYRDADEVVDTEELLRDVTLFDLVDCLRDVLSRVPPRIDAHSVDLEVTTIEEQMERIKTVLRASGSLVFASLFEGATRRAEVVTTFIALLELMRLGVVHAAQKRVFGQISIELKAEEEH